MAGRTDGNVKVIFPRSVADPVTHTTTTLKPGDYVVVKVHSDCLGMILYITVKDFAFSNSAFINAHTFNTTTN